MGLPLPMTRRAIIRAARELVAADREDASPQEWATKAEALTDALGWTDHDVYGSYDCRLLAALAIVAATPAESDG